MHRQYSLVSLVSLCFWIVFNASIPMIHVRFTVYVTFKVKVDVCVRYNMIFVYNVPSNTPTP